MKALLNDEGKKIWGEVFPSGEVPIKGTSSHKVELEGKGKVDVYLINWEALSVLQQERILHNLRCKFGVLEAVIETEIKKHDLPLPASLVCSVSIPARFF